MLFRLLRLLRLHPVIDLLSMHCHILRRIYPNSHLITFTAIPVTVTSSPTIRVSPTRLVKININRSLA
jgi:hypothetical protein